MPKKLRILLATMSMGIGGAETHIVELACQLVKDGHEVMVVSNGGVYVDRLRRDGAAHVVVPMHARKPGLMLKSLLLLDRAVRDFAPDVVHAHARIPALLAHYICWRRRVPLVTTVHGSFKVTPALRAMTRWGDRTLAVSNDLCEYVVNNYGIPRSQVTLTVNGINTELFAPGLDDGGLRGELGIAPEEKVVLTISRQDRGAADTSLFLLDAAETLYRADPSIRIVIVGGGDAFEEIAARAREVNARTREGLVLTTGPRTDTNRFLAMSAVFAGISRAALEAMACGKPTILAGSFGYLGRYSREIDEDCARTNLTCRECPFPDNFGELFPQLILECLKGGEEIERACRDGVEFVKANYSVRRMADDSLREYYTALQKYKLSDCVITGYYGKDNAGDDVLLGAVVANLRRVLPYIKIEVLASDAKRLGHRLNGEHPGVRVRERFNPFTVALSLWHTRSLIFGGGTLLQDNTSHKSLMYYLFLLRAAQAMGKKTMIYANGVGPIKNPANLRRVRKALARADLITLRDRASYQMVQELLPEAKNLHLTADEAMTLDFTGGRHFEALPPRYICLSLRRWKDTPAGVYRAISDAVHTFCERNGLELVFLIMEPENDRALTQSLAEGYGMTVDATSQPEKLVPAIRGAEMVVSMRLHALIFAACAGVPCLGVSYDPKVAAFIGDLYGDGEYCLPLEGLDSIALGKLLDEMYAHRHILRQRVTASCAQMRQQASRNAAEAAKLLGEGIDG